MTAFSLLAPAKINLSLKVLGRRDDGYHDLQSLMVALSVGDRLSFKTQQATSLQITCDHPEVPVDDDSLLARAFRFAAGRLDYAGGLEIHLEKQIPIGAGLGGGSSDAAAVMQAVARLTGRTLPADAYPEIAHQLGADIPFFLAGGSQWMEGIGERLSPCRVPSDLSVLLVNPGISVSTKSVYEGLPPRLTQSRPPATFPPSLETTEVLLPYVINDLESVVQAQYPVIATLKERLLELGADAALMSGSGSTVFGLYSQKKNCDGAVDALRSVYPQMWIEATSIL